MFSKSTFSVSNPSGGVITSATKRLDDCPKRSTNHDADRHVDHISLEGELFELIHNSHDESTSHAVKERDGIVSRTQVTGFLVHELSYPQ